MKVLFATDGAEPSTRAGSMLARLADPARTEIVVLSVSDFDVAMREAGKHHHYSAEDAHAAAQRAADEAAEALRSAGFERVESRVEDGDEAITIVHAAETEGFGLVVVGSGKERWRDTVVLGSVSGSIVHAAPCPVLVVHRAPSGDGPIRVVVGTDGSAGATRSIEAFTGVRRPRPVRGDGRDGGRRWRGSAAAASRGGERRADRRRLPRRRPRSCPARQPPSLLEQVEQR